MELVYQNMNLVYQNINLVYQNIKLEYTLSKHGLGVSPSLVCENEIRM